MQPSLANIFQPLINVFEAILKFSHADIGLGWGLAIIALTVLIRSLLLPLTLKQLRTMHRMAQFTPEIKRLREKHGSDPRRLQRETMAFYRENRINPLGSFLPAVAQLPVFLSVYFMLRTDLRHDICPAINPPGTSNPQSCGETAASHFLFIADLTSRATGAVLVALIVLYIGSQLFSFLVSANPTMDKTQRMIFIALPFLFIAIAWQLPAGVLVYWITTNTWTIAQGAMCASAWVTCARRRTMRRRPPADVAGWLISSSRCAARTGPSHRPRAAGRAPAATRRRRSRPARAGPQQGGLTPRGPAAASERPPAGAAPPQEEALGSTPVSGVTLGSPTAGRMCVQEADGRHPHPAAAPKLCASSRASRDGHVIRNRTAPMERPAVSGAAEDATSAPLQTAAIG